MEYRDLPWAQTGLSGHPGSHSHKVVGYGSQQGDASNCPGEDTGGGRNTTQRYHTPADPKGSADSRGFAEGTGASLFWIFLANPQFSMFFQRPERFLAPGMVPQGAHRDFLEVHLITSSRSSPWSRKWTGIFFERWFFHICESIQELLTSILTP